MKKKNGLFIIAIFILNVFMFVPIACNAWEVENTSISNIVVRDGRLTSFDFHFEVPQDLATTQSWLGLQAVKFNDDDFMDIGNIYGRYDTINDLKRDDDFLWDYKIQQFSEEGFSCFGEDYYSLTETLSDLSIDSDDSGIYYVYLWTQYGGSFYPDALLATVKFDNGILKVNDSNEQEIVDETFDNLEAPVVDKIEIDDVDFGLTVGKEPTFSGKIKNDASNFTFEETFMSKDRSSRFQSLDSDVDIEDSLVNDLKYFHISDIYIKDNVNLKFDENTKVYINGVEQSKDNVYISNYWISVSNEDDLIIPNGYIAPAYLDEEFEKAQIETINETIIKMAKAGGVKYDSDETKDSVNIAIQDGVPFDFELYISESITKSLASDYFEKEIINALNDKIGNNYKFAAYYHIVLLVYVDGDMVGTITELNTPVSITIPYPNGVPALSEGYERVWKIYRYHEGKVDILDAKETDNGISFENDKFSAFVLAYEDIKKDEINNPQTGDNIMYYISMLGLSIIGLVGIKIYIKNKRFN